VVKKFILIFIIIIIMMMIIVRSSSSILFFFLPIILCFAFKYNCKIFFFVLFENWEEKLQLANIYYYWLIINITIVANVWYLLEISFMFKLKKWNSTRLCLRAWNTKLRVNDLKGGRKINLYIKKLIIIPYDL